MASLYLFFVTLVLRFGLGYNTSHLLTLFQGVGGAGWGGVGGTERFASPKPFNNTAPPEDLQTFTHTSEAIKHPSVF